MYPLVEIKDMNEEIEIKIKLDKTYIKSLTHFPFFKGANIKEIEKFNNNIPDSIELNLDEDLDYEDVMQTKMLISAIVALKILKSWKMKNKSLYL